ncbi:hypothetical protein KC332_g14677 [Hortaea werneckii]|nr:hypothetical protein KC350_g15106 [Hortaea werneckii]KAI6810405.1 hypothetical protein KC342_g18057 [Hortaea werneckii]KAI6965895.1 hypothetical protein KC329_g15074 [Hortaea werneckii]KAI7016156.1 hypothetical protein KC366_g15225 [Hortaea werneckii]KAI7059893.1 hypothetical protein KC327_g14998 [Hortaea werneckii]
MSLPRRQKQQCSHEGCGSTRLELGEDGFTYCRNGHQQADIGTVVAEDTGELVQTGRKSVRKDSDAESTTSRASGFSGPKALEHYLLCLQLILRKQLRWLVDVQKLPSGLENLVHDLWALRLQKLQTRVSHESDTETEGQSQVFSSQSEGETSASEASRHSRRRRHIRNEGAPNVRDAICLCYMGALLLHEPVTVADFFRWITDGDLLYHRAAKEVPLGMRERLPGTYQELLEPQPMAQPTKLHQSIGEMVAMFGAEFGMAMQPINSTLVLYRWVRELALPIEIYAATQRLAHTLELDFSFTPRSKTKRNETVLQYPEVRFMAVVVVATKLLFPFDEIKRYPGSASDLSALSLKWSAWVNLHSKKQEGSKPSETLSYAQSMSFSQMDAAQAAGERLDEYMDWFEHNIASEDVRERGQAGKDADFRRALFQLFPVNREGADSDRPTSKTPAQDDAVTKTIREVQSTLNPNRTIEVGSDEKAVHRVGSFYRRYRAVEELEGPARVFFERCAGLAGISIEDLVRAVFLIESKLHTQESKLHKG